MNKELEQYNHHHLFDELSALIEQGKQKIAFAANSTLTLLFWHLGNRINEEVLNNERAEYGKRIIEVISLQLEIKFGRNFNEKNIRRMVRFSQEFSDFNILPTLSAKLSWSHFIELFPLKSTESKLYYAPKAQKLHQLLIEAKERIDRNTLNA
jgi:hypothetical protein